MSSWRSGRSVHTMTRGDIARALWKLRADEQRNWRELKLYSTNDLQRLYQDEQTGLFRLRDGVVSRDQVYALLRFRRWCGGLFNWALLLLTAIAAIAAVSAAIEGWKS